MFFLLEKLDIALLTCYLSRGLTLVYLLPSHVASPSGQFAQMKLEPPCHRPPTSLVQVQTDVLLPQYVHFKLYHDFNSTLSSK